MSGSITAPALSPATVPLGVADKVMVTQGAVGPRLVGQTDLATWVQPYIGTAVTSRYSVSGAIATSDSTSLIIAPGAVAMTLAAGTVDGHAIAIKRYGVGTVTVTATIDGVANTVVTMASPVIREAVTLKWDAGESTYLVHSDFTVSPVTLSAPLQRIRTAADLASKANPRIGYLLPSPPTITTQADTGSVSGLPLFIAACSGSTVRPLFSYAGGYAAYEGTSQGAEVMIAGTGTGAGATAGRVGARIDSIKFALKFFDVGTAAAFRIIVNGQYVSLTPTTYGSSGYFDVILDFTSAGGRAVRYIRIEFLNTTRFLGLYLAGTENVYVGTIPKLPQAVFLGDSVGAATMAGYWWDGFVAYLGDYLGTDISNSSVGGTGILGTAGGTAPTYRGRVTNGVLSGVVASAVFVQLSVNDLAFTTGQVSTEVPLLVAAIRAVAGYANTPIIVLGVLGRIVVATAQAMETAVSAACVAINDPNLYFCADANDPAGPTFTGYGYVGGTTGTGNCDYFISSDTVHPIPAGHALAGLQHFGRVYRNVIAAGTAP